MRISVTMLDRSEGVPRFVLLRVSMHVVDGRDIAASLSKKAVV